MKNIQKAQSDLVNDTCNDCGSFVDVGAVIDEHDTVLELAFSSEDAAKVVAEKATKRFVDVGSEISITGKDVNLVLTFSFSAEKMIFQLENSL
ncbi:hypothetical protein CXF83_11990 [Shewanella sp. Choline-02u-19]|uniref:DUF406 family protein n=1 Tax=unclassified Shewanella TaxID=196818 RepID=UPI000C34AE5D|nr:MULTISPECIES: DUF406 family protein [unclassified Shewanella]PKH55939.1 hypothetical protein CXF84_15900 [Shewanella sp. Bg11-22]PKI27385.1 hypothetical protein CXF83_11990 [Shewanella sp. Choline-02u-19]